MLDFDATDDPSCGQQEGRFFHGYYDSYCYLPLYVFCGEQLLVSYLRSSKIDGAKHAWAVLAPLVKRPWARVGPLKSASSGASTFGGGAAKRGMSGHRFEASLTLTLLNVANMQKRG